MLKRTLLPVLFVALLAACGQEEPAPAPAPAPETSAPATTAPEAPPAAPTPPAPETPAAPATEAPAAAAPAGGDLAVGEGVYKKTCALCHGTGAGGAPMLTKADWDARVAQGKDLLYKHAIEGFTGEKGMMPPKGGNLALSDDEVKASVDYMLSQLK